MQQFDEEALVPLGRLAQCLDYEIIAITIDDERRKKVRFAIHESAGFRIFDHDLAIRNCAAKPFEEKRAVNGLVVPRKHANRDLRFVAIKRAPLKTAAVIGHANNGARLRIYGAHVAAIDPKMPGADAFHASRADDYGAFCHSVPAFMYALPRLQIRYNVSTIS